MAPKNKLVMAAFELWSSCVCEKSTNDLLEDDPCPLLSKLQKLFAQQEKLLVSDCGTTFFEP